MAEKKLSRNRLRWLEREVGLWREDKVISEEQVGAILHRYVAGEERVEQGGRLVTVLSVLGAVLLGIGAILFFASNWQHLDRWVKVGLIFGCIVGAYSFGWRLAFGKKTYPKAGMALIFLGTLFYGSGIWLIAQIFHINSHFPNGVLFWFIGVLPVAYVTGSLPILTESSLLLSLWTVMEQGEFNNRNFLFLPLAALVLLLAYRMKGRAAVGLTLGGLVLWLVLANSYVDSPAVVLQSALFGLLVFSLGSFHIVRDDLAVMKLPFRVVGLLTFLFSLYLLTFGFVARVLEYNGKLGGVFFYASFAVLSAALAAAGAYTILRGQSTALKGSLFEGTLVLSAFSVVALLTLAWNWINPVTFLVVSNLQFFAVIIGVVVTGYLNSETELVNLGLLFFVLNVITRYFDFFWGTMNRSLFFMGGGLLLLSAGFLIERNRRKILSEMRVKTYEA